MGYTNPECFLLCPSRCRLKPGKGDGHRNRKPAHKNQNSPFKHYLNDICFSSIPSLLSFPKRKKPCKTRLFAETKVATDWIRIWKPFSYFKWELHLNAFFFGQLLKSIAEYIYFYNYERINLKDGLTPIEIRSKAA